MAKHGWLVFWVTLHVARVLASASDLLEFHGFSRSLALINILIRALLSSDKSMYPPPEVTPESEGVFLKKIRKFFELLYVKEPPRFL